jgi:hypothetical protein
VTESELLAAVRRLCDRHSVWSYHPAPAPVAPHERGFPDLVLVGTERGMVRELKGDGGQVSPDQWSVGYRMRGAGWDWGIWRPADLESGRIEVEIAALSGRAPWGVKMATPGQVGLLAGELSRLYGGRDARLEAAAEILGRDEPLASFKALTRKEAGRLFSWLRRGVVDPKELPAGPEAPAPAHGCEPATEDNVGPELGTGLDDAGVLAAAVVLGVGWLVVGSVRKLLGVIAGRRRPEGRPEAGE